MTRVSLWELICGLASIILSGGIILFTYLGNYIAPAFMTQDLIGMGIILGVITVGLILDLIASWLAARLLLTLGTLAFFGVFAISFVALLFPSAILALAATILAFIRAMPQQRYSGL